MRGPLEARFWAKVNKHGPVPAHAPRLGRCWIWTAGLDGHGYGQIKSRTKHLMRAHRVAWMFATGEDPSGIDILHRCDNPPCIRKRHLFAGDHQENMTDMKRKGRARSSGLFGEEAYNATLTARRVANMRRLARAGASHSELARRFDSTYSAVHAAVVGRTWKSVKEAPWVSA